MEHRDKAIEFYRKLLQNAPKDSPLRCDAMYAEGVAREELGQAKEALQVYAELLEACADGPLVGEVMIRRGELLAKQNQHAEAIAQFQKAVKAGGDLADYAQYRYAASLLLAGKTDDAAQAYLELVQKFPNSQYVNSAKMASAQSFFQAEKFDKAGPMFQFLLKTDDPATVIEAAHWLAQIALRQNKPADVMPLAEQTLAKHKNQAPYRDSLQLDIADALVALNKPPEALKAFAAVYEHASDKNLVGRSLYGAAFTALQSKDSQTALTLANRFLKQFPNDALTPDAAYVAAEAMLQASNFEASQKAYDELLKQVKDHPNRGIWELRAITAAYLGGKYDAASERARQALNSLKTDREKAEANYLLGGSELLAGRPDKAIPPLTAAASAKGVFPQVDESILLLGQAQANAKDSASAKKTWQKLVAEYPNTSLAEQGHYRLGQLLASEKEFAGAEQHYDAVLKGGKNEPLRPYSLYGKGWSLMQLQKYEPAIEPLDKVLKDFPEHAVKNDALLARGISLHHLKRNDDATKDLEKFLASKPMGHELGHALYELALGRARARA